MENATNERIEALRAALAEAQARADVANREVHLARAELEEAEGDTFNAKWSRAVATGDHATAHACWIESEARRVLAGKRTLEAEHQDEVAAEVERLRAEVQ